jgi:hypothetical protein
MFRAWKATENIHNELEIVFNMTTKIAHNITRVLHGLRFDTQISDLKRVGGTGTDFISRELSRNVLCQVAPALPRQFIHSSANSSKTRANSY